LFKNACSVVVNQKSVELTDESECKVQPDAERNLIVEEDGTRRKKEKMMQIEAGLPLIR
jgi:hypothetical protein